MRVRDFIILHFDNTLKTKEDEHTHTHTHIHTHTVQQLR